MFEEECYHDNKTIEYDEVEVQSFSGESIQRVPFYVCDDCDEVLDLDPILDMRERDAEDSLIHALYG